MATRKTPEPQRGIGARGKIRAERDHDRRGRRGVHVVDEDEWRLCPAVGYQPILGFRCNGLPGAGQIADIVRGGKERRCRSDDDCRGIKMG